MPNLKGQNFRVLIWDATTSKMQCVAKSTNCVINLTANTEDGSHKDITGMAAVPTIVSKGWNVQVDSLDVSDATTLLTAIKSGERFLLRWDETSTADNQTLVEASFNRQGYAYLNDLTLTFDDRANSTKNIQFTGTSAIQAADSSEVAVHAADMTFTKGQYVRLFLGNDNTATPSKVIAAAKTLSLHVSVQLEESTTKDTADDWQVQTPTGISYDISTSALMRSGETITSSVGAQTIAELETIYQGSNPVKWKIANVSGINNRTPGNTIISGSAIITSLQLNGPNRQDATYNATLNGVGDYTVRA